MGSAALALTSLLVAGGASATSTIAPTPGDNPRLVGEGTVASVTLELVTTDLVSDLTFEIFGSGSFTISCGVAIDVGAPAYDCTDIAGGIQVSASDFDAGLASGLDLVVLLPGSGSAGSALTLGTFTSTFYRLCPTGLGAACFADGIPSAFTNDGLDVLQVVPEPGTLALVATGLVGLAIRRR